MPCKITKCNGTPNTPMQKEYMITDVSDIAKLPRVDTRGTIQETKDTVINDPCSYGSTALLVTGEATEVYILTPNNEWVKM